MKKEEAKAENEQLAKWRATSSRKLLAANGCKNMPRFSRRRRSLGGRQQRTAGGAASQSQKGRQKV